MTNTSGNIGTRDEIHTGLPETPTLGNIFAALKNALKLVDLIPEIGFDGCFGDLEASDENRPMQALRLASLLRHSC